MPQNPFANTNTRLAPQSLAGAAVNGVKNAFGSLPHGSYDPNEVNSLDDDINSNMGKILSGLFSSAPAAQQHQPASAPPIPDPAFPKGDTNMSAASRLGGQAPTDTQGPPNVFTLPGNGPNGQVSGLAKYGGPQLNTPGALKDFSANQYQPPKDNGISLEELFKIASSPQNQTFTNQQGDVTGGVSRALGAQQWGQEMLSRRIGEPSESDLALLKILSPEKVAGIQGQTVLEGERIKAKSGLDISQSRAAAQDAALQMAFASGKPIQSFGGNPQSGAFHITAGQQSGGTGERGTIDRIIAQLNRDHISGVINDDEYAKELEVWNQRYGSTGSQPGMGAGAPAPAAAPQDVSQFVTSLRARYPHATAQQLMQVIEDPNGEYQGFDSDADRQILLDAFHKNGIQ